MVGGGSGGGRGGLSAIPDPRETTVQTHTSRKAMRLPKSRSAKSKDESPPLCRAKNPRQKGDKMTNLQFIIVFLEYHYSIYN